MLIFVRAGCPLYSYSARRFSNARIGNSTFLILHSTFSKTPYPIPNAKGKQPHNLGLLATLREQPSTFNLQPSTFNFQLSTFNLDQSNSSSPTS
ncbi:MULTISPECIES: hypothetical protein [unclassified Moorena]|uniref:hypothetical protein n=1 Tax=unclassified Moorena TaxID=2683338 RepID=UPI0013BBC9DC|nr:MULTISPECIES: hypothetical protein [unclassified Moorena]NEP36570.1 hypothetical protein [Moorena sp. SIO3B2]NEQ07264.1 hypothetical protein [Moorena sp. SIO4E2]NER85785.1 hypothetical protein [Moorena sp. SIO3A2]NES45713.1 hypothetical protein [Moorena sp. SIO2C4]NET64469.1 hypothetical protein [Moorena sp. SIO1G6]